jgi:Cell division protein FtsL
MRRLPQQQNNSNVARERDERADRRQFVVLVSAVLLAGGFVVAIWQHFSAVQYGYKNEALRQERAHLLAEQQQLQLALDEAAAPAALERAARQLGMQPARATQMSIARHTESERAAQPGAALAGATVAGALNR